MRLVHIDQGERRALGRDERGEGGPRDRGFVVEERALPSDEQIDALRDVWLAFVGRVSVLLSRRRRSPRAPTSAMKRSMPLLAMVRQRRGPRRDRAGLSRPLRDERTEVRFQPDEKDQAETLARKLGKPKPEVRIDAGASGCPRRGSPGCGRRWATSCAT